MLISAHNKNHDILGVILFSCILMNLLPVIVASSIIPGLRGTGTYTILVGCMFVTQTIILLYYFLFKTTTSIDRRLMGVFFLFIISQPLTLFFIALKGFPISDLDYLNIFVRVITFASFLLIISTLNISKKSLNTFCKLLVMLAFVACCYNIIKNLPEIFSILHVNNPYAVDYKSFYINRNSFAQLLILGIIANTLIYFTSEKSNIYLICYVVFAFNIFATFSRTGMLTVGIFLFVFSLFYIRKKMAAKILVIAIVFICFLFILFNEDIKHFVLDTIIREDAGVASRDSLWLYGIELLNQHNWILGVGYYTGVNFLEMNFSNTQFHNSYIEVLVGGGIVELLIQILIICLTLRKILSIIKKDKATGSIYVCAYISFFVYSFFESITFFSLGYVGTLFTIFFVSLPWLYSNYLDAINTNNIRESNI